MSVLEKILKKLNDTEVSYEKLEHAPVYTSEDAAKIRDADISIGAKALVLFGDKSPLLAVIPGNLKVDFKKFKSEFGIKDLRMATPQEVTDLTGLEIGAIPPLGSVLDLQSYYDESINNCDESAFNAGDHCVSVIMKTKDLVNLENPIFGNFAKN